MSDLFNKLFSNKMKNNIDDKIPLLASIEEDSDESLSLPGDEFTSEAKNTPITNTLPFSSLKSSRTKKINNELQSAKTSDKLNVINKLIDESELHEISLRIFLYNYKEYLEATDDTTKQNYRNILQGNSTS